MKSSGVIFCSCGQKATITARGLNWCRSCFTNRVVSTSPDKSSTSSPDKPQPKNWWEYDGGTIQHSDDCMCPKCKPSEWR